MYESILMMYALLVSAVAIHLFKEVKRMKRSYDNRIEALGRKLDSANMELTHYRGLFDKNWAYTAEKTEK